jgi:hypothetical protein
MLRRRIARVNLQQVFAIRVGLQGWRVSTARASFADIRGKAARHAQVAPITDHIKAWFTSE